MGAMDKEVEYLRQYKIIINDRKILLRDKKKELRGGENKTGSKRGREIINYTIRAIRKLEKLF